MAWKRLTVDDLRTLLSEDEVEKLTELATLSAGVDVQNAIDIVSDTWRGALQAKGVEVDVRDHYTPASYRYWILVHSRWAVWTRFPGTPAYALDDARKEVAKTLGISVQRVSKIKQDALFALKEMLED